MYLKEKFNHMILLFLNRKKSLYIVLLIQKRIYLSIYIRFYYKIQIMVTVISWLNGPMLKLIVINYGIWCSWLMTKKIIQVFYIFFFRNIRKITVT